MKKHLMRRSAVLALAAVMLTGSASALFGSKKEAAEPVAGAPTVQDLKISTYRDIPYQTQFLLASSEGDVTYAVAEEPKKGTVTISGSEFTYTPEEGVTGSDSFTYTATDSQGRVSQPATVQVRIEKSKSGVKYADMGGSPAAAAAQYLAESGIFTGAKIGENYYFEPDATVSRSEFLALAMETAGREVTNVTITGFCDDESIPAWAKAYAAAGVADPTELQRMMAKKDSLRRNYYNHYTNRQWGDSHNYHLTLDSGVLGDELCAQMIISAARGMQ